jgi:hypothetical protein
MRRPIICGGTSTSIARCVALWLLVLIVTPFTAPFATCELGNSGLVMTLEDEAADSLAKLAAAVAAPPIPAVTQLIPVLHPSERVADLPFQASATTPAPTPLRL